MRTREDEDAIALSERTPVKLSLIIGIATLLLGSFGVVVSGVWWASATNTKLANIETILLASQAHEEASNKMTAESIVKLEQRVLALEIQGSPAVISQLNPLKGEVQKLREDFELHKATTLKQ